jgi:hypothetical protein
MRAKVFSHSKNVLECLPLLIATIWLIISDIDDEKFPQHLLPKEDPNEGVGNKKIEVVMRILCKKLENCSEGRIIELKDTVKLHLFKEMELQGFFTEKGNQCRLNLNNEEMLVAFTNKLNCLYENGLKFKHFDERIFLYESNGHDFSPIKITPFKRQKSLNFEIKKPAAFKKLDYSGSGGSRSQSTNATPVGRYDFSQMSNSSTNLRFINNINNKIECATPCSRVFMMDKWVSDYIKDYTDEKLIKYTVSIDILPKDELNLYTRILQENLNKIIKLMEIYHERISISYTDVLKLTGRIIADLLHRDEKHFPKDLLAKLLVSESFLKSVLVVSVEIALFICNVEGLCFFKLAEAIELDLFEFWKLMNPIHLHFAIPSPLRVHFSEIEIQLFTFMIWKKASLKFKSEVTTFMNTEDVEFYKEIEDLRNIEFNNQTLSFYFNKSDFESFSDDTYIQFTRLRFYKHVQPIYVWLHFNF